MANRLSRTVWGGRVTLNFAPPKHPVYIVVPKNPSIIKVGDKIIVQSGEQSWAVAPQAGIILNSAGEPFLKDGKTVVNLAKLDCQHSLQANFWQIVGGDFRGLQDRSALSPGEFGRQLAKWLANPHGCFPFTTLVSYSPYKPIFVPFGGGQLAAHSSAFQHAHRFPAGTSFILTADERPEFPTYAPSIIEISIYEARTGEAITKWVLDRNANLLFTLNGDHSITYWAALAASDHTTIANHHFIPGANFRGQSTFGFRFQAGRLQSIQATNYQKLRLTLGAPLLPAEPLPVMIGSKLPARAKALGFLNGYFTVEANWQTGQRPVNFWFKKDYYLEEDEIKFLGLTKNNRKLFVRFERGLATEIFRADDLKHARPIYLGVRRTANGELLAVFHRSIQPGTTTQSTQIYEGVRTTRVYAKRYWRIHQKGGYLDLPASKYLTGKPTTQVCLAVKDGQIIFWQPGPRFSKTSWAHIRKTWGEPAKPEVKRDYLKAKSKKADSLSSSNKFIGRWASFQQGYISLAEAGSSQKVILNIGRARRNRGTLEKLYAKAIELANNEKDQQTLHKLNSIKLTLEIWLRRLAETSNARTSKAEFPVDQREPENPLTAPDGLDELECEQLIKLIRE